MAMICHSMMKQSRRSEGGQRRQRPLASAVDRSLSRLRKKALVLFCILGDATPDKAYPDGCSGKPPSYYDYESTYDFPPSTVAVKSFDDYLLTRRLGTGKFSDVFEAVDVHKERKRASTPSSLSASAIHANIDPRALVVVKCLKPVSERKIRREVLVLERASKLPNLVRLLGIVMPPEYANHRSDMTQSNSSIRNNYSSYNNNNSTDLPRMPALVLQHAGPNSQWLCHGTTAVSMRQPPTPTHFTNNNTDEASLYLSDYEIRYYLYHLLSALDGLHKAGIMHRDVKPRNVLINRRDKYRSYLQHHHHYHHYNIPPCMLIDLGLADFYHPMTAYNVRVASRHYKAPELLLGYPYYDYAIDMWGVGCILVGLLLRREPFFRGKDNLDQLGKIVSVLGTEDLWAFVQKYQVQLSPEVQQELGKYTSHLPSATTLRTNFSSGLEAEGRFRHRQSWLNFAPNPDNDEPIQSMDHISRDALDLLDRLLVYDHEQRWTARQAMQHRYFDVVRDRVRSEVRLYREKQERSSAATGTR